MSRLDRGRSSGLWPLILLAVGPVRRLVPLAVGGGASGPDADLVDTIRKHSRALQDSHRHNQALFSALSHDLKGPIVTATTMLQSHQREAPPDPRLDRALDAMERLGRFVDRLALLSQAGKPASVADCDLSNLLQEAVAAQGAATRVAAEGPRIKVRADPARLRDAVGLLLENALEHSDVRMTWTHGPLVELRIIDQGPGFAFNPTMFNPFSARNERPGVSAPLGLPAAYRLLRSFSAGLKINSGPRGTVCIVILEAA